MYPVNATSPLAFTHAQKQRYQCVQLRFSLIFASLPLTSLLSRLPLRVSLSDRDVLEIPAADRSCSNLKGDRASGSVLAQEFELAPMC